MDNTRCHGTHSRMNCRRWIYGHLYAMYASGIDELISGLCGQQSNWRLQTDQYKFFCFSFVQSEQICHFVMHHQRTFVSPATEATSRLHNSGQLPPKARQPQPQDFASHTPSIDDCHKRTVWKRPGGTCQIDDNIWLQFRTFVHAGRLRQIKGWRAGRVAPHNGLPAMGQHQGRHPRFSQKGARGRVQALYRAVSEMISASWLV